MHTYSAATSPPSLVQQVWWRDRLDQQHDVVVLMVQNFCGRASPTRSHGRETCRVAVGPAARVGEGEAVPQPSLYIGGWAASLAPPPSPRPTAKVGGVGRKFPPPSRRVALGFPLGWRAGPFLGMVCLAQVARTLPLRPT
jgi:hypothetical protein